MCLGEGPDKGRGKQSERKAHKRNTNPARNGAQGDVADATGERCGKAGEFRHGEPQKRTAGRGETILADAASKRVEGDGPNRLEVPFAPLGERILGCDRAREIGRIWEAEPRLGRVVNGVPDWSHRIKCLGNAVVPQIPELLGRAYLESIEWGQAA